MKINVLLDQNISREGVDWLQKEKPEWTIYHTSQGGLAKKYDQEVFSWAQDKKAIIITYDEDFADRRSFSFEKHYGIVRLKVWPTTIEETIDALKRLFSEFEDNEIYGSMVIIDRNKIRIRQSY